MANDVTIPATGSGDATPKIATDDVSGVHYQYVKLADGTADSPTVIPGGANGLFVQGQAAHDAAAAGNPIVAGASAANAFPAAVANADAVRLIADLNGRMITAPYTMPEKSEWYASAADIADTADDEVFAAVANISHYITQFTATNSHATVGTYVVLKDNDTVMFVGWAAAAGGGFAVSFPVPLKATNGVHVNVANVTTGSATRVSVSGFQAP